jgi:hypothetical protein
MGLIDAIDPDADDFVRRVVSRARLLPAGSVAQVKRYFQDLAPITQLTRHQGLAELTSALLSPAFAAAACP